MSDSDCSNCDKYNQCEYRDYTYECYIRKSIYIKEILSHNDILKIKDFYDFIINLYKKTDDDSLSNIKYDLLNIIELYEFKSNEDKL